MRKQKPVADSFVIMTELVLPNDTNTLNNLMGGRMMHLMDIAAAIAAQKHSNRIVVTASVDNVSFRDSIRLGNVVTLQAQVTRAFSSADGVPYQSAAGFRSSTVLSNKNPCSTPSSTTAGSPSVLS